MSEEKFEAAQHKAKLATTALVLNDFFVGILQQAKTVKSVDIDTLLGKELYSYAKLLNQTCPKVLDADYYNETGIKRFYSRDEWAKECLLHVPHSKEADK